MRTEKKDAVRRTPLTAAIGYLQAFGKRGRAVVATLVLVTCFSGGAGRIVPAAFAVSFPKLSKDHPVIPLEIGYTIEDAETGTLRPGKLGGNCRSGDVIHLSVSTGTKCRVLVFCIDSMMVPIPVLPQQTLSPVLLDGGKLSVDPFHLNKVTGTEIYYVIASREEFSFEEITPFLDTTLSRLEKIVVGGQSKGPVTPVCELQFPPKGKFSSAYIYFNHLPGTGETPPPPRTP